MVYADELDIHLNPKIGPDWMLPGTQRLVLTLGNNEKRYLAGAYEPLNGRLVYVEGDRKASWIFLNLLRALLEAYEYAKSIHLILDSYIIHNHRQKTIDALLDRVHGYLGQRFDTRRRMLLVA